MAPAEVFVRGHERFTTQAVNESLQGPQGAVISAVILRPLPQDAAQLARPHVRRNARDDAFDDLLLSLE